MKHFIRSTILSVGLSADLRVCTSIRPSFEHDSTSLSFSHRKSTNKHNSGHMTVTCITAELSKGYDLTCDIIFMATESQERDIRMKVLPHKHSAVKDLKTAAVREMEHVH